MLKLTYLAVGIFYNERDKDEMNNLGEIKEKLNEYFEFVELDYKNVEDIINKNIKSLNVEDFQPKEIIKMLMTLKREGQLNEKIYNYENWKTWKSEKGVDLDDTRGENPFIRAIYYLIWDKSFNVGEEIKGKGIYSKGWGNFTTSECLPRNLSKCVWGGDCANTIASYKKLLEGVTKKESLDTLCGRNHQIGNFILVPAYFNKWRGRCLEDRFDKSLLTLKNDPEKSFDFYNEVQNNLRTSKKSTREEKIEIIKENFKTFDCAEFNTYINWLFLWDYVFVKNGEYLVKDMTEEATNQSCVKNAKNQILPKNMNELNVNAYVRNVNYFVKRRNLFIAAMLYIALECVPIKSESDWSVSTIYAVIMKKILLNENQVFSGYEDVIKKIKDAVEKEKNLQNVERIKAVLDVTLDKITSVKY